MAKHTQRSSLKDNRTWTCEEDALADLATFSGIEIHQAQEKARIKAQKAPVRVRGRGRSRLYDSDSDDETPPFGRGNQPQYKINDFKSITEQVRKVVGTSYHNSHIEDYIKQNVKDQELLTPVLQGQKKEEPFKCLVELKEKKPADRQKEPVKKDPFPPLSQIIPRRKKKS